MRNSGLYTNQPTLLIIDGAISDVISVMDCLENLGYHFESAQNGENGLRQAVALIPDLILLDTKLPDMAGFEVCRRLKIHPLLANIPVIFLIAPGETAYKINVYKAGGVDYICKPILFEELAARVGAYLLHSKLQTAPQGTQSISGLNSGCGFLNGETDKFNQIYARIELLDFALNLSNEAVFLIDELACFQYVNQEACRSLGYTRNELMTMRVCDIDPDFTMDRWEASWEDIKRLKSLILETTHKSKDGQIFPVEIYGNNFDYGGQSYNLALVRNISARKSHEVLQKLHLQIFEKLTNGAALREILDLVVCYIEQALPNSLSNVMLLDKQCELLYLVAGRNLPAEYAATIDGMPIGESPGPCAAAIRRRETVIVGDIACDPDWAAYQQILLQTGILSCWFEPIFNSSGNVLGVLGIYHRRINSPDRNNLELLRLACHFAAIAIERSENEERLRASERKFRNLAENAPDNIMRYDRDACITYINPAMARTLGVSAKQLEGKRQKDLFPNVTSSQLYTQYLEQVIATGQPLEFELISEPFDNSRSLNDWIKMAPDFDDQGLLVGVIAIGRNISEQKQLERELRAISNCNQILMRAQDEQTLLNDICHIICNDAGYESVRVDYVDNLETNSLRSVALAGIDPNFTPPPHKPESSQIPYCISLPLRNESGITFGALNIYSATEFAFSENEVRLLEELAGDLAFGIMVLRARIKLDQQRQWLNLLEHVLNHMHEAVYLLTDLGGNFIYVNKSACLALNYSQDELLGMGIQDIDPDFSIAAGPQLWEEMLATGHISLESRHRRRDGQLLPVEILTTIVNYQGANISISLVRDITERKQAEQKLRISDEILRDSEARYRMMFQNSPLGMFRSTLEGSLLEVNKALAKMFGYDSPESLIAEVNDIAAQIYSNPEDRQLLISKQTDGQVMSCLLRHFRRRDGSEFIVNLHPKTIHDLEGQPIFLEGIIEDITDRYHMEEQLRIAAIAFEAQEAIIITSTDGLILRINRAFTKITGYELDEVVGLTPLFMGSDLNDAAIYIEIKESVQDKSIWQGEAWSRRKNGEAYPVWLNISTVKNNSDEITHYVGMMTDITERKAAEKEIEQLAFYDPLTHLPNRRLLQDRLHRGLHSSFRSQSWAALMFIDLDNFKILNDTCGHDTGDRLLIMVAERLMGCVREGDTISRIGGDEFVIILENLSPCLEESSLHAKKIGEKILCELTQPYIISERVYNSTPSIGITLFSEAEKSVQELLKQADIAMYEAKSAGRNTIRFFNPDMELALATRAGLEAELRQGIKDKQFVLYYQPQANFAGDIISAEALIRWRRPERGIMLPHQFIGLAEETGLILTIGLWVVKTACAQLKKWMDNPVTAGLQLAINVSPLQFRQADFVDQVRHALVQSGAPPSRLKMEFTESLVLEDVMDTIAKMNALIQLGLSFSIDDFGTGYSSLSYLTRLPLDQLKIDQSFIRNLPDNANDAAVVQTIITLAKSLQLSVIAEGVENETQLKFLNNHGCPTYQGYLLSKPLMLEEFEQFIGSRI